MLRGEAKNHSDDYYICFCCVQGFDLKNKQLFALFLVDIIYKSFRSPDTLENPLLDGNGDDENEDCYDSGSNEPKLFTQVLPKNPAGVLGKY